MYFSFIISGKQNDVLSFSSIKSLMHLVCNELFTHVKYMKMSVTVKSTPATARIFRVV